MKAIVVHECGGPEQMRFEDAPMPAVGAGQARVKLSYSGVNFGDVPESRLLTDGQQSGLPGSAVFYTHQFVAGTAGQVTFSTVNTASPANSGWSHVLYRDANGNGQIDAGEPVEDVRPAGVCGRSCVHRAESHLSRRAGDELVRVEHRAAGQPRLLAVRE